tara:strand:- start:2604 stop:2795 length:192 start_codon:yes stop_codon:yes gene_type:complete
MRAKTTAKEEILQSLLKHAQDLHFSYFSEVIDVLEFKTTPEKDEGKKTISEVVNFLIYLQKKG